MAEGSGQYDETSASADDEEEITGVPLIFMFQPTKFIVTKGDKLREWEELMLKNVGLEKFAELKAQRSAGFETTSVCPGTGNDDCDWHEQQVPLPSA